MVEIVVFIRYLKFKYNSETKSQAVPEAISTDVSRRFGAFPELQAVPSDIDFCNDEIVELFGVWNEYSDWVMIFRKKVFSADSLSF